MGVKNNYVLKRMAERAYVIRVTRQHTMDVVQVVLSQYFNFTPEMLKDFHDKYIEMNGDLHEMQNQDIADNKDPSVALDISYSNSVLDRALKDAVGDENYVPRDERYAP